MQTSADPAPLGGSGTRAFIRSKTHPGAAPAALVTLDNLGPIARPPRRRRRLIRMSALSTFDGTFGAYHGDHGWISGAGRRSAARRATACPGPLPHGAPRMPLTGCPVLGSRSVYFEKIRVFKAGRPSPLNTAARNNGIGLRFYFNIEVQRGLIRHCKEERNPLAVVFIDFAQAFDSVSHEHILSALGKSKSYTTVLTCVEVGGRNTPDIKVRVGVKQGDPLSPLLFNLALDPLIQGLERNGRGYIMEGGQTVVCLAFADDLVLVGGSWKDMAYNLHLLDPFCQKYRAQDSTKKMQKFLRETWCWIIYSQRLPSMGTGGEAILQTSISEAVKYLGVKVNPWGGVVEPELTGALKGWVKSIGKSLLKPSQRVVLLNQYALPRLYYQADLGEVVIMCCEPRTE
ncbi:hypothetical protein F2P79_019048 [Pimephales promelas]|nr:hypothetical protein F2P79_019048 [Pimephales promelas]